jgi:hypothetical protein
VSGKIFLSYRRDDSGADTGRISDRLKREFGDNSLFIDVESIPPGVDFVERLTCEIAQCDLLVVVIGSRWLDIRDKDGANRLADPADWVRVEVRSALASEIPILPILLGDAKMPHSSELPDDIKNLTRFNAINVRHSSFHPDVDRIAEVLELGRITNKGKPLVFHRLPKSDGTPNALRVGLSSLVVLLAVAVAEFSSLMPPYPSGISAVTTVIGLVALAITVWLAPSWSTFARRTLLIAAASGAGVASVAYAVLLVFFTYKVPASGVRSVKGFVCKSDLLKSYQEACPFLGNEHLRNIQWSAEALWQSWSIDLIRVSLILTWLVAFFSLSILLISLVTKLRPRAASAQTA